MSNEFETMSKGTGALGANGTPAEPNGAPSPAEQQETGQAPGAAEETQGEHSSAGQQQMREAKSGHKSDARIIELYFARDESAISETDAKYKPLCLSISKPIVGEATAPECVNDAYLATWNAIPPTRPKSLKAYLAKVVRNISLKRYRDARAAKRGSGQVELCAEELTEVLASADTAFDNLAAEELASAISAFLWTQEEEVRRVFVRRYWKFDSIGRIAADEGFTSSKVKMMLSRTRERLRGHLEQEGLM